MTLFFTPRFPVVAQSWLKTFTSMSSIFNKKRFVVEDTFQFEDFEPTFNWAAAGTPTMVATGLFIYGARCLKIRNLLFICIEYNVTLAAPLYPYYTFTIPYTVRNPVLTGATAVAQGTAVGGTNAGTSEPLLAYGRSSSNTVEVYRGNGLAYTAGSHVVRASFFLEVEE